MNKVELAKAVANETGVTQLEAREVIDATFNAISKALEGGEKVVIPGFGTFSTVEKSARNYHNPFTKELDTAPAHIAVKFSVSEVLKNAVR